ncbi:MAG: hypothetical protein NT060_03115 [Candidatus Omnitrophica bacterium]|nr:hypothetical protein [Candidatus Omnitrophota bacterium]
MLWLILTVTNTPAKISRTVITKKVAMSATPLLSLSFENRSVID